MVAPRLFFRDCSVKSVRGHSPQMSHVALRPAVRYWFTNPHGTFPRAISAALADVGTEKSYRRGWMAGAGFSYGYAAALSPR